MRCTCDFASGTALVTVEGRLTASQAGRLHQALLKAFDRSRRVELALRDVSEADLSFLQLLCAAHRTAVARGAAYLLSGLEAAGPVLRLIRESGAERDAGCPGECLWSNVTAAGSGGQPQ